MGITVVSAASLNTPGTGSGSLLPVASGGVDFAALLTQQLADPQLLGMEMEAMAGTSAGSGQKETAEDAEDSPELDVAAFLAAAGLLPAAPANQSPSQGSGDALAGRDGKPTGEEQIMGIGGRSAAGTDRGLDPNKLVGMTEEDSAASLATDFMKGDTAIIAGEGKAVSGNDQNFAATLAAHSAQAQRANSRGEGTATATVHTPINDSRWSQDFGEKIVWLAKNDQQVAQLNINPPQLGPMQITLSLNGDQASALFVSAHAEVRQAIQDAMPQLREMLAGAGINLGQADVGTQLAKQQNGGDQAQTSGSSRSDGDNAILRAENDQGTSAPLTAVRGRRGMVDLFA